MGGINIELAKPPRKGYLKSCEAYEISRDTWEEFPELPIELIAPTAIKFEDKYIYVVGGLDDSQ